MGIHLRVLSESYPMNTKKAGLRCFSKFCILVMRAKLASALEGFIHRLQALLPIRVPDLHCLTSPLTVDAANVPCFLQSCTM